jgi:hypothetical protein
LHPNPRTLTLRPPYNNHHHTAAIPPPAAHSWALLAGAAAGNALLLFMRVVPPLAFKDTGRARPALVRWCAKPGASTAEGGLCSGQLGVVLSSSTRESHVGGTEFGSSIQGGEHVSEFGLHIFLPPLGNEVWSEADSLAQGVDAFSRATGIDYGLARESADVSEVTVVVLDRSESMSRWAFVPPPERAAGDEMAALASSYPSNKGNQ